MSFLKKVFGPSKEELWRQVADQIDGELEEGGFFKGTTKLRAKSGEWEIVLDTYIVSTGTTQIPYTRIRAPFINRDDLRLQIYKGGLFSNIGKFFGMQDILTGDQTFDDTFIIKGSDEDKVALLLRDHHLRQKISEHTGFSIVVQDNEGVFGSKYPENVDVLSATCAGILTDTEQLKNLFELFSMFLERLVQIGSAYEDDPKVAL